MFGQIRFCRGVSAFLALWVIGLPPPAAAADEALDEIVVVAQRKSERLLDVGINVSSLSADQLRAARIEQATDLAGQIPNIDVKSNIPGAQSIITIRGVGLDDFSSTNNSTVGVYVDDIFLASFAEMDFNFFDLDHLEVLKGPQGTLYGRNSTAGAINVISAKPSTKGFESRMSAGYGHFRAPTAEGMLNIPVSDQLAVRLSVKSDHQDRGYWSSNVLRTDLGRQDNLLGRLQALWSATDALTVLLKFEGNRNRSSIGVGKFFGTVPKVPGASCPDFAHPGNCTDALGYTDVDPNPFRGDWNHPTPYDVDSTNTTMHLDADFGWSRLTSISGYINFRRHFYTDADAAPTVQAEFDQHDQVKQFSEELRLTGNYHGIDWLGGAYYSWDTVDTNTPGYLTNLFNTDVLITAHQKTRSIAGFGQVKWPIAQRLSLTTGLRYTSESRRYAGGTTDTNPNGFSFLCFALQACSLGAPGPTVLSFVDEGISDRNWSWRTGLDFKPNADTLLYASVAKGHKSGGFFNGITTNDFALAPYKPESLTDYEVGLKWASRTLQFGTSLFYYDYKDLQTQTFTNVGAVSLIKLGNVEDATIYGADIDLTWLAFQGLTVRTGLGLLHTKLGSFRTALATGPVTVPAGNRLPDAPTVSFNTQIGYEHRILPGWLGAVQASAAHSGSVFKEALNTPYLAADAYWLFDARLAIRTDTRAWEMALWGRNLSNKRYVMQATDNGIGMGYRVFNAPRTYGVTATYYF
jgi:iron complex outermembrane receptor protein